GKTLRQSEGCWYLATTSRQARVLIGCSLGLETESARAACILLRGQNPHQRDPAWAGAGARSWDGRGLNRRGAWKNGPITVAPSRKGNLEKRKPPRCSCLLLASSGCSAEASFRVSPTACIVSLAWSCAEDIRTGLKAEFSDRVT